jgi:hypothetical protein
MNHILDEYTSQIITIFQTSQNKYEAHLKSHPVLVRMSNDDEVIMEAMRRALQKKSFYRPTSCVTPDFQISLIDIPEVFLFASFFGPNRDKETDVSYSTMHHHDDYLLSTINAKGAGYNSIIWKKGYKIDHETKDVEIEVDKYVPHSPMKIEFIDSHTAHTLFYPKAMTMTYALWSNSHPTTSINKARTNPFIQKNKALIKKLLRTVNMAPTAIGVNQYREDYFNPENGKIKLLPGQVLPPNGNHPIQNRFNILQEFLGFDDLKFLKNDLYGHFSANEDKEERTWIEKYIDGEKIERNYDGYEFNVPKRNVHISEYHKCYNQLKIK